MMAEITPIEKIKRYVLTGLAKEVNEEVIKRLPKASNDYLAHNNEGQQTVTNRYYAYTKVSDDYEKVHIDFYVHLGKLSGVYRKEVKDYESEQMVRPDYDPEKEYQKRLRKGRRKKK